jgi:hypothetical protein
MMLSLQKRFVTSSSACPRYGKEIACLLTEKDSRGKIKKVERFLKSKSKKSGTTGNTSTTA